MKMKKIIAKLLYCFFSLRQLAERNKVLRPMSGVLIVILLYCCCLSPSLAQEATPSEELIKEKIKERLEQSVTGKIKGLQEELEQKPKKKAFIGTVKTIGGFSVVLETDFGERKASISPEAEVFYYEPGKGQTEIEISSLEAQDYLILMGILENNVLDVQRVIKMPEPETYEERELLFGEVSAIDDQEVEVITQTDIIKKRETFKIDKDTPLKFRGQTEATLENIQIGDQLYAVVVREGEEISEVKKVLIIPGKNNPLSEENLQEATEAAETGEASPPATP